MNKFLGTIAIALGLFSSASHAALVTVPFQYQVNFVDPSVSGDLGLAANSLFGGSATYDDATAPDSLGIYTVTGLNLAFGNFSFTAADDISGFGAGVGVSPTNAFQSLYFETALDLTSGPGAGNYLLSFAGSNGQLTTAGDTFNYQLTASAVPLPAALPLMLAGLGFLGLTARRRRAA